MLSVCSVGWLFLLGCQYGDKSFQSITCTGTDCTSASDWPERHVSEMAYNVLMGTLNPTHSLTHFMVSCIN